MLLRDRIQKQIYPKRRNTATILNYLEELVLINAKEVGLVPIGPELNGYQDMALPFGEVFFLEVPEGAVSATMMVEFGGSTTDDNDDDEEEEEESEEGNSLRSLIQDARSLFFPQEQEADKLTEINSTTANVSGVLVRFKENGSSPELDSGFGLGNQDIFELVGEENLSNFQIMSIQQGITPILRIQFYATAQQNYK